MVLSFLLGYEEQIEADCLRLTVQLALQGTQAGIPIISDIRPTGPRVVLPAKAIELGVSYALESGVDGIALPWPGPNSFETIRTMAAGVPLWIKPAGFPLPAEMDAALDMGATGLWLDEKLFSQPDPLSLAGEIFSRVHSPQQAGQEA